MRNKFSSPIWRLLLHHIEAELDDRSLIKIDDNKLVQIIDNVREVSILDILEHEPITNSDKLVYQRFLELQEMLLIRNVEINISS